MSSKLKNAFSTVYATVIVIVCVLLATICMVQAWSERASRGTAAAFAIFALLFVNISIVLLFQAYRYFEYRRVLATLGFLPLDWKKAPFNDLVLRAIFQNRKEAFVSRLAHGDSCGMHFYVFNWARDTAWWSKKRTTLVFQPMGTIDDVLVSGVTNSADAEINCYGDWCMIQARREIQPRALPHWLGTMGTLCHGK